MFRRDSITLRAIRQLGLHRDGFRAHVAARCCVPVRLSPAHVYSLFVDLFESEFWTRRDSIAGRYRHRKRRCLVGPDFQQFSSSYSSWRLRRVDFLLARAVGWFHRLCLWSVFHCPWSIVPL